MPALFLQRRYNNSKTARTMKNVLTKIGAALLDDPRLSGYNRFLLQNLLNMPIETLRQFAGNDDASLLDVISFIVKAHCSEIVGLTVDECMRQTNTFVMTCHPAVDDTLDDDEILVNATASVTTSVTILKDHITTTEKMIDEALVDVKAMPAWSAPSTCPGSDNPSATLVDDNDYSDDDDIFEHKQMKDASDVSINDGYVIFEHQQRKDASDVSILTNPSPTSAQRKDASDSNILTLNCLKHQENDELHIYDNTTTNMKLMHSENFEEEDHITQNDENHTTINTNNNDTEFTHPKRNYVSVLHDTHMSPSSLIVAFNGSSTFNVNINVHQNLTKHDTGKDPTTIHHSSHDLTMPDTEFDTHTFSPSDTPSVSPNSEASLYNYWENDSGDRYYSDVQDVYLDEYPSESDFDDDNDKNYYNSGGSVDISV